MLFKKKHTIVIVLVIASYVTSFLLKPMSADVTARVAQSQSPPS